MGPAHVKDSSMKTKAQRQKLSKVANKSFDRDKATIGSRVKDKTVEHNMTMIIEDAKIKLMFIIDILLLVNNNNLF